MSAHVRARGERQRPLRRLARWPIGAIRRGLARGVTNPEMRRYLVPREHFEGPRKVIEIGEHSYFSGTPRVHRYSANDSDVHIGRYCSLSAGVEFMLGGQHQHHWLSTFPFHTRDDEITSRGPIVIGNDVWVGAGAMIMSGVTIASGAVVGSRAVVTRDVRPYAIVVGSPAREIARRFDDATVDRLLTINWWDWPAERVQACAGVLQSDDIEALVRASAGGGPATRPS
jgi:chloramphenicol O-acetyltransferase type B